MPEHEELVVEFFEKPDDHQWGGFFRQNGRLILTVGQLKKSKTWSFDCRDLIEKLQIACNELDDRQPDQ